MLQPFGPLRRSPLAIDYYCWLAYRLWRVDGPTLVSWEQLHLQFGSNYDFETKQGRYGFRWRSQYELTERVLKVYPDARVKIEDGGLRLFRSLPPIPLSKPRWVRRFLASGIKGLTDRTRSGRPPDYDAGATTEILKVATAPPQDLGWDSPPGLCPSWRGICDSDPA